MPTLLQRFARITPYLRAGRMGLVVAALASLVGAATEPMIPALMQPLLDKGFSGSGLPLWSIPVVIIGLFTVRGAAGFVADYAMAWTANGGVLELRRAMFERLLAAACWPPGRRSSASARPAS